MKRSQLIPLFMQILVLLFQLYGLIYGKAVYHETEYVHGRASALVTEYIRRGGRH